MKQKLYTLIIAFVLTALFLGGGLMLLSQSPQALPTLTPTPSDLPLATVNGQTIGVNEWAEQYLLDQVLSRLSGQPAPTSRQTLDRLINEALLLQTYPQTPPDEAEVEQQILDLKLAWQVDDATLTKNLSAAGLSSEVFTRTVRHLLMVKAAQDQLAAEHDPATWFGEMRQKGNVTVDEATFSRITPPVAPVPR